jgi:hypothetical protein
MSPSKDELDVDLDEFIELEKEILKVGKPISASK